MTLTPPPPLQRWLGGNKLSQSVKRGARWVQIAPECRVPRVVYYVRICEISILVSKITLEERREVSTFNKVRRNGLNDVGLLTILVLCLPTIRSLWGSRSFKLLLNKSKHIKQDWMVIICEGLVHGWSAASHFRSVLSRLFRPWMICHNLWKFNDTNMLENGSG